MQQIDMAEKPELAPVPIWRCTNSECKTWMRDELVDSEAKPVCPLCKGSMIRGMKHFPKLVTKHKAPRKSSDGALTGRR